MKVHACELPMRGQIQSRHIDLSQVNIHFTASMSARQRLPVDNRQSERKSDTRVNATLTRSRVNESMEFGWR